MRLKISIFSLLLFSYLGGLAQSNGQDPFANSFYGITDALIEERLQQIPTDTSGKIAASVKEIQRLKNLWGPRLFPHGDVTKAFAAYNTYIEDWENGDKGFCGTYDDVEWTAKGVTELPGGSSGTRGNGQINRVTFSPGYNGSTNQTLYGSSHYGGAFKSTNGGGSWTILGTDLAMPFSAVGDLAVDHGNENNLFIAGSNGDLNDLYFTTSTLALSNPRPMVGMYRSTNGGDSWENISGNLLDDFTLGGSIRRVVADPSNSNVVLIATTNGVYRCANALSASPTWTLTGPYFGGDPDIRGLEFKPGDHNTVYASGKHIHRSTDNGLTWTTLTQAFAPLDLVNFRPLAPSNLTLYEVVNINLAVTPADPNRVYAYIVGTEDPGVEPNSAFIFASTDGGYSWSLLDNYKGTSVFNVISGGWIGIAVSPTNPNAVYYGHTMVRGTPDYTSSAFKFQSPYSGGGYHADVHDLVFEPISTSPKLYCGHHGGVSSKDISHNNSSGWTYLNSGLHCGLIWTFDNSLIKKEQFVIGSQDAGVSVHAADATNWRTIQGGDGYGAQIYNEEGFYVMGKGNGSIRSFQISPTNSTLYSKVETSTIPYAHVHSTTYQEEVPVAFQVRYHPLSGAPIFGINDLHERIKLEKASGDAASDLWKSQSNLAYQSGYEWFRSRRISDFEIAPSDPDYAYIVVQGRIEPTGGGTAHEVLKPGLFRSTSGLTDGDESLSHFTNISSGLPVSSYTSPDGESVGLIITGVEVDPENENRIWVSLSGYEAGKKVWYSSDAGNTWSNYDPTGSLSNLPVNDIVYQPGSDDRIFAATDAGVYVKEGTGEWCRYGNIPNVRVMEIRLNPCDQSLVAATLGRGLWEAPTPSSTVAATFRTIISNETWTGEVFSTGNVIVKPGKTLTVEGTLHMPKNGKVFVEPGGKLKVRGGTITNSCGDLWGGIEAWGVTALGQNSGNQGEVVLSQGAVLEHAQVAIDCWKTGDWAATGGIAKSYNSTFRNNKRDVSIMHYSNDYGGNHYPNRSVFVDTDFYWDEDFRREIPLGHVAMYKVDGIYFTGCRFADNRTAPIYHDNNVGIRSIDAQFSVIGTCPGITDCTDDLEDGFWSPGRFDNLRHGIYASNVSTERTITVDRCVFTNNQNSVLLKGLNSPTLVRNLVKYTDLDNLFAGTGHQGFWLEASSGLRVEENRFENSAVDPGSLGLTVGVLCEDLGETDERIYKNTFKRLSHANLAIGNNRSVTPIPGDQGLQFLCNSNEDNVHDHYVYVEPAEWTFPGSGVKSLNGSPSQASGNTFTSLGNACEDYDHVGPWSVGYFYNAGSPDEVPMQICGTVLTGIATSSATCSTNFPAYPITELPASTIASLEQQFLSASAGLSQKQSQYLSLLNGGDTDALLQSIQGMNSSNAAQIRQQLLGYSPFLSEEVIRLVVDKPTSLYSHAWAHELVLNNLDVARTDAFMDFLATKTEPLPNWMQADIQQQVQQGNFTAKLIMEGKIADLAGERDFAADMIVRSLKQDTSGVDHAALRTWMLNGGGYMAKTQEIEVFLQEGDFNTASSRLSALASDIPNAPQHLQAALSDYVAFKQFLVQVLGTPSQIANLSNNDLNFVRNTAAQGSGIAQVQAQELLCFFYGECAVQSLGLPSNKSKQETHESKLVSPTKPFHVYPNPANNQLNIELPSGLNEAVVSVVDMQGKLAAEFQTKQENMTIETTDLVDGIYFVSVRVGDRRIGTVKVAVQH